jgi:hypothetical protein
MVARLAVIEGRLRNIVYSLLELKSEFGRIAVRNPRVEDSLGMIQDLMKLRGFTTTVPLKGATGLITACKELERFRDKVAHGVWVFHGKNPTPVLQVTAGSYSEAGEKVSARIAPMALAITLKDFQSRAALASRALKGVDMMSSQLKIQHTALIKKREQQSKPVWSRQHRQPLQTTAKP